MHEVQAATAILVLLLVVIPLLPNRTIDPLGLLNPYHLGILVTLLAAIQFVGYVSSRLVGARLGIPIAGFFGGFASSTAVFVTFPQMLKGHASALRTVASAAMWAVQSSTLAAFAIVIAGSESLPLATSFLFVPAILSGSLIALVVGRSKTKGEAIPALDNPLSLRSALQLGFILFAMIVLVGLAERYFGATATLAVVFLGALFELHSVVLATTTLFAGGHLSANVAVDSIAVALVASYMSKLTIAWIFAKGRFAWITSAGLLAMVAMVAAGWAIHRFAAF